MNCGIGGYAINPGHPSRWDRIGPRLSSNEGIDAGLMQGERSSQIEIMQSLILK